MPVGGLLVRAQSIAVVGFTMLTMLGLEASPAAADFILATTGNFEPRLAVSTSAGESADAPSSPNESTTNSSLAEMTAIGTPAQGPFGASIPSTDSSRPVGAATMPECLKAPGYLVPFLWLRASSRIRLPQATLVGIFRPPRRQPSESVAATAPAPASYG